MALSLATSEATSSEEISAEEGGGELESRPLLLELPLLLPFLLVDRPHRLSARPPFPLGAEGFSGAVAPITAGLALGPGVRVNEVEGGFGKHSAASALVAFDFRRPSCPPTPGAINVFTLLRRHA